MATLSVSPWEYGEIRKNAADKTEAEFIGWALGKWPWLADHMYENIDVVVDWGGGEVPTGEAISSAYILSIRPLK
jgi:hypothetical protein